MSTNANTQEPSSTNPQPTAPPKKTRTTMTKKAGIIFPVARIDNMLRAGKYSNRCSKKASVYLASVLEYVSSEVIEQAVQVTLDANRTVIRPQDLMKGIQDDAPLNMLLSDHTDLQIAGAGWVQLPFAPHHR